MRFVSSLAASRRFSRAALSLASSCAFDPGFARKPVLVGGPQGCLLSQMNGGRMADVFMTKEHRVTLLPPVKLYSNLFLAPAFAFVLLILALFQSVPFITRFVTGLVLNTNCGLSVPPSW